MKISIKSILASFFISCVFTHSAQNIALTTFLQHVSTANSELGEHELQKFLKALEKLINPHVKTILILSEHKLPTTQKHLVISPKLRLLLIDNIAPHYNLPTRFNDPIDAPEIVCPSCRMNDSNIDRYFWQLPCNHILCLKCFQSLCPQANAACPTCSSSLSNLFPL